MEPRVSHPLFVTLISPLYQTILETLQNKPRANVDWYKITADFRELEKPILDLARMFNVGLEPAKLMMEDNRIVKVDIDIMFSPPKAIEHITVNYSLTKKGLDFSEIVGANQPELSSKNARQLLDIIKPTLEEALEHNLFENMRPTDGSLNEK